MELSDKIKREIARREAKWKKATPAQKRVLIAKDVIALLRGGRVVAAKGIWFDHDAVFHSGFMTNAELSHGIREIVMASGSPCTVCGMGAMMLSCTLYANKAQVKDRREFSDFGEQLQKRGHFTNGFEKLFSKKQLCLIEYAFEGDKHISYRLTRKARCAVEIFYTKHSWDLHGENDKSSAPTRLIAIMRNIIKNKGRFIP